MEEYWRELLRKYGWESTGKDAGMVYEEETAFERQHGPVRPRQVRARLAEDPEWDQAFVEFRRLRQQDVPEQVAVSVFTPFLKDPERRDSAEFILLTYGYPKEKLEARLVQVRGVVES